MRKFFGDHDEKSIFKIISIFLCGLILLIISRVNINNKICNGNTKQEKIINNNTEDNYERNLEIRLENLLSQVNGVGNVKVMITLSNSKEMIIAQDSNQSETNSHNTDKDGTIKEIQDSKKELKKIILDGKKPVVLKEIEPKIEGVIIIAQGGNNAEIKSNLIKAVQAILNVQAHKIQVLKMKDK
jgi:stage III sporulation protein AG